MAVGVMVGVLLGVAVGVLVGWRGVFVRVGVSFGVGEGVSLGRGVQVGEAVGSGVSVGALSTTIGVTSTIAGTSVKCLLGAIGGAARVGDVVAATAATVSGGLPLLPNHIQNRIPMQISASKRATVVLHSLRPHGRNAGRAVTKVNA